MFLLRLSGIFCIYTRLDFCISIQFSNTVVTVRNESRQLWNIWCTFAVVHVVLCDSLLQWLRVLYFSPRWYLQNLPSSSFCFGYWVMSCWKPPTLYYNMIVWLMSEGGHWESRLLLLTCIFQQYPWTGPWNGDSSAHCHQEASYQPLVLPEISKACTMFQVHP